MESDPGKRVTCRTIDTGKGARRKTKGGRTVRCNRDEDNRKQQKETKDGNGRQSTIIPTYFSVFAFLCHYINLIDAIEKCSFFLIIWIEKCSFANVKRIEKCRYAIP